MKYAPEAGLNRSLGQGHAQMRFSNTGRPQKNNVAGFVNEPQRTQFLNLPFIDGRLKAKVELVEVLQERQVRQLHPRTQLGVEVTQTIRLTSL
jgi:hypothetical protein